MKFTMQLEFDAMEQAVQEFLERRFPGVMVEKVEWLDEDLAWRVHTVLPENPAPAPASAPAYPREVLVGVDHAAPEGDQTGRYMLIEPEDELDEPDDNGDTRADLDPDVIEDGEELEPLTDEELIARGIDPNSPEGKIKAKEMRRQQAELLSQGKRARNITHVG